MLTGKHTREEWLERSRRTRAGSIAGLKKLDDQELLTLADYLSFNMPLPADKIPADLAKANWNKLLPRDGRDLALELLSVLPHHHRRHHPGPDEGGLARDHEQAEPRRDQAHPQQREALASYLVLNGGIPIDQVPEESAGRRRRPTS